MADSDLRELFDRYKSSVFNKDLGLLMSIYDKNIHAFDTWSLWSYDSLDAWRAMNENWLQSLGQERDVIEFDDVKVDCDENIGFASAVITYSAISEGGAVMRSMQTRLTWIAKKHAGEWKIVHQHTSVPIDDRNLGGILNRK